MRWKGIAIALLAVAGGFFEGGCSASFVKEKAGEAFEAAWDKGKELVKNEIATALPALEAKVLDIAEKKVAEREAKDLAAIDSQLALLPTTDPTTGLTVVKKWQEFDSDHDGHVTAGEYMKLAAFVSAEGYKRVQAGTMSKDTFLGMEKNMGVTGTSIVGTAIATYAITNRRKKNGSAPADTTGGAPGGPKPPPGPAPAAPPPKPA